MNMITIEGEVESSSKCYLYKKQFDFKLIAIDN